MRVVKHIRNHGARFGSYLFAFVLLKGAWWLSWKLGSPSIDQIIYHLQNGNEGLGDADPKILRSFLVHVVASPLLFATILFAIQQALLSDKIISFIRAHKNSTENRLSFRLAAQTAFILRRGFKKYIPIGLVIIAGIFLANNIALFSHLKNLEESEFFQENYKAPSKIVAPKKKLNLVLIYVESLENGFSDSSLMGKDLLASLNDATAKDYRFNNYQQTTGTGWTIAGIVSSQCGIPLKSTTIFDGNMQGEIVKSFLPGAKCLGDILLDNGYKNIFLGGASLYFAGKGKFLSQHGYSELYGKEEWSRIGEKKFNEWGLFDDDLFKHAKSKLDILEKSKKPFNLTLLTVDTHFPDGLYSPTCINKGAKDYKGIVSCTADQIADFLSYMKHRGYLKNTVVVILGDHLAMQVPVHEELESSNHRTIFNRFITPNGLAKNRDDLYHFSMFPTILYALGFRFDQSRLGLGVSGFGPIDEGYEIPRMDQSTFNELIAKSSERYRELWVPH
jgi:phosphoglycerol transferase